MSETLAVIMIAACVSARLHGDPTAFLLFAGALIAIVNAYPPHGRDAL